MSELSLVLEINELSESST